MLYVASLRTAVAAEISDRNGVCLPDSFSRTGMDRSWFLGRKPTRTTGERRGTGLSFRRLHLASLSAVYVLHLGDLLTLHSTIYSKHDLRAHGSPNTVLSSRDSEAGDEVQC